MVGRRREVIERRRLSIHFDFKLREDKIWFFKLSYSLFHSHSESVWVKSVKSHDAMSEMVRYYVLMHPAKSHFPSLGLAIRCISQTFYIARQSHRMVTDKKKPTQPKKKLSFQLFLNREEPFRVGVNSEW
jgi:hypothetical protein